ncbi:CD3324 family protein [Paenibacillus sp. 32352]|uniref:CD3324 family protein n=1 Tax=Paenibacillus sp. 32352 TaxID=1969111 RepID=UPI00277B538B|nr:CD3324 family protein [Paenibacillus sp. 32352]
MKYENACDVLPEELLREVQKYAAGKLLYIPSGEEKRAWGETSGYREKLQRRNLMIRNKYANGMTVSELADEYFLSLDSIKKIIYSKKNDRNLTYCPTIGSAVQYASIGMIEEWIQCYLLLTHKAAPLLHDFIKEDHLYFGVVKLPLRLVQYDGAELEEEHGIEEDTAALPPLLIQYEAGKFYCIVQQELLGTLKQHKVNAYPTIIVLKGNADYKRFMKYYGTVLFFVDKG